MKLSPDRRGWMMPMIDSWPREWRELVHEYGFNEVRRMMINKHSVSDARLLLAVQRRMIEELTQ